MNFEKYVNISSFFNNNYDFKNHINSTKESLINLENARNKLSKFEKDNETSIEIILNKTRLNSSEKMISETLLFLRTEVVFCNRIYTSNVELLNLSLSKNIINSENAQIETNTSSDNTIKYVYQKKNINSFIKDEIKMLENHNEEEKDFSFDFSSGSEINSLASEI